MFFTKLPVLVATSFLSLAAARVAPTSPTGTPSITAAKTVPGARSEGKRGGHHGRSGLCEQLGCSDAQRAAITEIRTQAREKVKGMGHGDDASRAALAKAMRSGALTADDAKAALALHDGELEARRAVMATSIAKIHGVLDTGQREKLAQMIEKHGVRSVLSGGGHHGKGDRGKGDRSKRSGKGKPGKKLGNPGGRGKGRGAQPSAKR